MGVLLPAGVHVARFLFLNPIPAWRNTQRSVEYLVWWRFCWGNSTLTTPTPIFPRCKCNIIWYFFKDFKIAAQRKALTPWRSQITLQFLEQTLDPLHSNANTCCKPIRLLIKTVVTKPYDYLGTLFDPVNTSISTHSVLTWTISGSYCLWMPPDGDYVKIQSKKW